ncbi:MAG: hypothetical protein QOE92_1921 [Chloroflexota bacterium]|nr:hypothetical protein [Chloroflexota bacterium]
MAATGAPPAEGLAGDEERAPVELRFWRTIYRYLLSIVASLAAGFAWSMTGARFLNLGMLGTISTGVLALAAGILLSGYLWLTLDIGRPVPEGVDEQQRNTQLFVLWLGIPLAVLGICAIVGLVAIVLSATVLGSGLPAPG